MRKEVAPLGGEEREKSVPKEPDEGINRGRGLEAARFPTRRNPLKLQQTAEPKKKSASCRPRCPNEKEHERLSCVFWFYHNSLYHTLAFP